jgi:hypothetical protein
MGQAAHPGGRWQSAPWGAASPSAAPRLILDRGHLGEYVGQIPNESRFKIDAFIVPVRDLVEAATSRVVLERRAIHQHNPWMAEELDRT